MTQCTTRGRERNDSVGNENLKTYYAEKDIKERIRTPGKKAREQKKKKNNTKTDEEVGVDRLNDSQKLKGVKGEMRIESMFDLLSCFISWSSPVVEVDIFGHSITEVY